MKNVKLLALLCGMMLMLVLLISCGGSEPTGTTPETDAPVEDATHEETADPNQGPDETEAPSEENTEAPTEAVTDYFDANRIETVKPDELKVPDMAIAGDGYDIFQMKEDTTWGYRYGCTYLYNDDGTIDAYFACPGADGEWDWISYRHSPDGGETWTTEKMVLNPTQGSMDFYSCCDPGVVYFNGYYYLGYTSTLNSTGACNNLFVARSKNPDGPFEKWNGSGWGGHEPQPIVYYTTEYSKFGIGEVSFVELNGTLYIYYTDICPGGDYTMVATADATNENWPATMQFHGAAVEKVTDSLDIKYVEDWGKFVGVATGERMGPSSWLGVFESNDGIHFEMVEVVRKDTYSHLHNAGLSSRRNGHINLAEDADKLRVIYAYGSGWGTWNTRVQPITLTLADKEGYSARMAAEKKVACKPDPVNRAPAVAEGEREYVMVRVQKDLYEYAQSKYNFVLAVYVYDEYFRRIQLDRRDENLSFKVHDESVITIDGIKATIHGVGYTAVDVYYGDTLKNVFYVNITEDVEKGTAGNPVVSVEPVFDSYTIYMGERNSYRPQARVKLWHSDGSFEELYVDQSDKVVTYSGYDEKIIKVDSKGVISAQGLGETEITLTYKNMSCKVKVTVTDDASKGYFKMPEPENPLDYTNIDFSNPTAQEAITQMNGANAEQVEGAIKLTVTADKTPDMTDALLYVSYAKSPDVLQAEDYPYLEITYMVPTTVSSHATRMQLFFMSGGKSIDPAASVMRNIIVDGEYHTLRIDLSNMTWWSGEINTLRVDFFDYSVKDDVMFLKSIRLVKE